MIYASLHPLPIKFDTWLDNYKTHKLIEPKVGRVECCNKLALETAV